MNRTSRLSSRYLVLDLVGQRILLTVVIGLPLWVNLWSVDAFEPAKASMLRLAALSLILTSLASYPAVKMRLMDVSISGRIVIVLSFLWGGVYMLAALASVDPLRSIMGSAYWRGGVITQMSGLVLMMGVVLTIRASTAIAGLLRAVSLGSIPVALYALLQVLGQDLLSWETAYPGRSFSTLGNPNVLAGYLAMVLPVTIMLMLIADRGSLRYLLGLLVAIQLGALISTLSRGGYLAVAAGLVVIAVLMTRKPSAVKASFLVLAIVLMGTAALRADPGATGIARILMWKGTLQMISMHPWLGFGPEMFDTVFPPFQPAELLAYGAADVTIDHAHNLWLDLAAESGVLGVMAFSVFVMALFVVGFQVVSRCTLRRERLILSGLLASLIAYLVQSQFMFQTVVPTALFWVLVGVLLVLITSLGAPIVNGQVNRNESNLGIAYLRTRPKGFGGRIQVPRVILTCTLVSSLFLLVAGNNPKVNPSVPAPEDFWGLQVGWAVGDRCDVLLTHDLAAAMRNVGAESIRVNFRLGNFQNWTETDTCGGKSALDLYDEVVDNLQRNGLNVLGLLGHEAWHGTQAEWQANNVEFVGGNGDNDYLKEFSHEAAGVLVSHFYGRVNMWEIWNEPNAYTAFSELQGYSGGSFIYPSNFAWLLRYVYLETQKAPLPGVKLITGGVLGGDTFLDSHLIRDARTSHHEPYRRPDYDQLRRRMETNNQLSAIVLTEYRKHLDSGSIYIRATYDQGRSVAGWREIYRRFGSYPLDGIGQHLYIDQGSQLSTEKLRSYLQSVRQAYVAFEGQDTSKQTFVTEVGWATTTVDKDTQALNLRLAYNEFWNTSYVASAFWFQFSDVPAVSLHYGLVSEAGDPNPAWNEYRDRTCCGGLSPQTSRRAYVDLLTVLLE